MRMDHYEFWDEKLERVKAKLGIETYAGLARHLRMSKQGLAHVRAGRQELSAKAKLIVLTELGGDVSEADFEGLLPYKTRSEVGDKVKNIFDPDRKHDFGEDFWVKRINQLQAVQKGVSDYELARSLSISPTMISEQRKGNDGLSSVAKIRILDTLGYTVARDALISLLPPRIRKRIVDFDKLRFVARGDKRSDKAQRKQKKA